MALLQSPPPLAVSLSLGKAGDAVSCFYVGFRRPHLRYLTLSYGYILNSKNGLTKNLTFFFQIKQSSYQKWGV